MWLLQTCVEGGSGYSYPKPKYTFEIVPSIELFSKSISFEESPVTQNYQRKHYQGHNYAQGYTTVRSPIRKAEYQGRNSIHSPAKPSPTKRYHTAHYYQGPLIEQPSIQSSQKANAIHAPKAIRPKSIKKTKNELIMDMGEYKISIPLSSDGIIADGEYLVKIPVYETVVSK